MFWWTRLEVAHLFISQFRKGINDDTKDNSQTHSGDYGKERDVKEGSGNVGREERD